MASSSLRPGAELAKKDNGDTSPSPYSSFAISIDTRGAETFASHERYDPSTGRKPLSAMKHTKAHSAASDFPFGGKRRSYDGVGSGRPGVRFANAPSSHHRRSSTAAFLEYVRDHIAETNRHRQPPVTLTLKRAFLMFCIVFSATYLALALLPIPGYGSSEPAYHRLSVKRGAGYYGNSHIFQAGENLRDPHLEGDEHEHKHRERPEHDSKLSASPQAIPGEAAPLLPKKLKSSTLNEHADLHADGAVLEPLPVFQHVDAKAYGAEMQEASAPEAVRETESILKSVDDAQRQPLGELSRESNRKKPVMPFKKLEQKEKAKQASRLKTPVEEQAKPASEQDDPAVENRDTVGLRSESNEEPGLFQETDSSFEDRQEEEEELERKLAKLKKEISSRRDRQKAKGPARQAVAEAPLSLMVQADGGHAAADPKARLSRTQTEAVVDNKSGLRKVAAMRRKDSAYDQDTQKEGGAVPPRIGESEDY